MNIRRNDVFLWSGIRYIPQSGLSKTLKPHSSIATDRSEAHAIGIAVDQTVEQIRYAEVSMEITAQRIPYNSIVLMHVYNHKLYYHIHLHI